MIEARILNNTIPSDVTQFSEIVDEYATFQRDKPNALYCYESMTDFTIWLKKQFLIRGTEDFVIAGLFYNGSLIKVICGYKLEVAWNKPVVENVIPYYVIGLLYFKERSWKIPTNDITALDEMITSHFESRGFSTGFMTVKAPKNIISTTNGVTINKHINEIFVKTWGGNHNYYVEKIFRTQKDIDEYKFRAFKVLVPKRLKRPLLLLTFKLKQAEL
jgi:hypothetical protein